VRLIRAEENDSVVAVAKVVSEKEEREIDGENGTSAAPPEQSAPGAGLEAAGETPPAENAGPAQ
jgi:hypothetical protein